MVKRVTKSKNNVARKASKTVKSPHYGMITTVESPVQLCPPLLVVMHLSKYNNFSYLVFALSFITRTPVVTFVIGLSTFAGSLALFRRTLFFAAAFHLNDICLSLCVINACKNRDRLTRG